MLHDRLCGELPKEKSIVLVSQRTSSGVIIKWGGSIGMALVTLNKLKLLLLVNLFLLVQLHLKLISELTLIDLTLTALHLLLHLLLLLSITTTERRRGRKTHLMRELIFKGAKEGGLLGGGHGGRLQPSIRAGHDRGRTGGVGGTAAAPTAAGSTPSGTAS